MQPPTAAGDLRVIELGDARVQYAGKLLADMGADLIKVEPPGGEAARRTGPFVDDLPHPDRSLYFWHYNTSKRGITLDIHHPSGPDLLRRLLRTADVFLEGQRPGVLEELGLAYESLAAENPGLVHVSVTPFGRTGPWRDFEASDFIHLALGGEMASCGYDDPTMPPVAGGGGQAYHIAGNYAAIATMMAVVERDFSGQGQFVDVPVHLACATCTEMAVPNYLYRGMVVRRQTGRHATVQPSPPRQFRCRDGVYVNLMMPALSFSYSQWAMLVQWLDEHGMAEDLKDERYRDPAVRVAETPHISEVLGRFAESLTSEQVFHGGQLHNLPWAPVRAPEENLADLHFHDRGFWHTVEHPEIGRAVVYPGAPYRTPEMPWRIARPAPRLGEHNMEVYCGELGYSVAELGALREAGVI